jgi:hypothetical protein
MIEVQFRLAIGLPIIVVFTSLTVSVVPISNLRRDLLPVRGDIRGAHNGIPGIRDEMREIRSDIKLLIDLFSRK